MQEEIDGKKNDMRKDSARKIKNNTVLWITFTFLGASAGAFVFLFAAAVWTGSPLQSITMSSHSNLLTLRERSLTSTEVKQLTKMIEKGYVTTPENLISNLIDYYSDIINILVALNAVIAGIAYLCIRTASNEAAEQKAEQSISVYFNSTPFKALLEKTAEPMVRNYQLDQQKNRNVDLEEITALLEEFSYRLDSIEEFKVKLEAQSEEIDKAIRTIKMIEEKVSHLDRSEENSDLLAITPA